MKSILLLTTLSILASASYEKAQEFYDMKDYVSAIKEAKASTSEYSNPKLHLLWAKSEEALGHTKEAMSAYERVTILDESDTASRLKLVKIYAKTHRDELSQNMSKKLLAYQLTPKQRSSLDLLTKDKTSSFKAKGSLSIGYDSNINISATSTALDDYEGLNGVNDGEKATLFSRFIGSVSYVNDLKTLGGWYFRGDARAYYQNNADAHYFDMAIFGVEAGLGYAGNGYTLYLPVGYDRVNYLDSDLLGQVLIEPNVNFTLSNAYILKLKAKYSSRTYSEAKYKAMGDSSYGIGADLYYFFGKNFTYSSLLWEKFSSSEDVHFSYLDKDMLTLSLGLNYNLSSWLVTRLDYRYRRGRYDDTSDLRNPSVTSTREDSYNQVEVKFSHYFAKKYELFISDRYVNNSSNYVPAEYTKNIAMFGISANY